MPSSWNRDEDNVYRCSVRVPVRLTHNELAWAMLCAFEGESVRAVDWDNGEIAFAGDPLVPREVRAQVTGWLGHQGTGALVSSAQAPAPGMFLEAAAMVFGVPWPAKQEG